MAVYDIADGSIHRFRFDNSLMIPRLLKCLGKCLDIENYDGGVMVMNLECDTAVSLKAPNSIENGTLRWNLISDRLVLIEEYSADPYKLCANIAVWTGLERQARGTSLAQSLYGRHVEYTSPEYQKFIPEVYDLTPIYGILGEEKASAAVADYYSLICEERQALPPLYRLIHGTGITREQLKKYNQTAENKLSDDVIEALYLDSALDSAHVMRVKQALLAETSLFYDGKAYSLWEALSGYLPADVMVEYLGSIEGYVQRNCSQKWITHVANAKEEYIKAAKNPKKGDAIYSFNMIASQGKQAATYRIDVVLTGRYRNNTQFEDDLTVWGEFELRAFDKSGKQTGSVKLYSDVVNQYGSIGLDTQSLSGSFITDAADNIIVFSMPNGNVNDNVRDATIYGITISGELFMYEIEDSEVFRYISPNPGGGSMSRVSADTVIVSDLNGRFRPNFEGDTDNTKYLCDFYSDDYFREISFYRVDEMNRRIIPHIYITALAVKVFWIRDIRA